MVDQFWKSHTIFVKLGMREFLGCWLQSVMGKGELFHQDIRTMEIHYKRPWGPGYDG